MKLQFLLLTSLALALNSCTIEENGITPGTATQLPGSAQAPSYGQPLTATKGQGTVTIREGSTTLATLRTASPNVEETRWYSEQEQIVVKSRGNHGPATVQLFNSRSGQQLGQVMAYDIKSGQPAWANGMGE